MLINDGWLLLHQWTWGQANKSPHLTRSVFNISEFSKIFIKHWSEICLIKAKLMLKLREKEKVGQRTMSINEINIGLFHTSAHAIQPLIIANLYPKDGPKDQYMRLCRPIWHELISKATDNQSPVTLSQKKDFSLSLSHCFVRVKNVNREWMLLSLPLKPSSAKAIIIAFDTCFMAECYHKLIDSYKRWPELFLHRNTSPKCCHFTLKGPVSGLRGER